MAYLRFFSSSYIAGERGGGILSSNNNSVMRSFNKSFEVSVWAVQLFSLATYNAFRKKVFAICQESQQKSSLSGILFEGGGGPSGSQLKMNWSLVDPSSVCDALCDDRTQTALAAGYAQCTNLGQSLSSFGRCTFAEILLGKQSLFKAHVKGSRKLKDRIAIFFRCIYPHSVLFYLPEIVLAKIHASQIVLV